MELVRDTRLRWFGYMQRKDLGYVRKKMLRMELPARRGKSRSRFMDIFLIVLCPKRTLYSETVITYSRSGYKFTLCDPCRLGVPTWPGGKVLGRKP